MKEKGIIVYQDWSEFDAYSERIKTSPSKPCIISTYNGRVCSGCGWVDSSLLNVRCLQCGVKLPQGSKKE